MFINLQHVKKSPDNRCHGERNSTSTTLHKGADLR